MPLKYLYATSQLSSHRPWLIDAKVDVNVVMWTSVMIGKGEKDATVMATKKD